MTYPNVSSFISHGKGQWTMEEEKEKFPCKAVKVRDKSLPCSSSLFFFVLFYSL